MSPVQSVSIIRTLEEAKFSVKEGRVSDAYWLAERLYDGEMHWSGRPLMDHLRGIIDTLMQFQPDEDTVIACLLHHVLDTQKMTLLELEEEFGPKIRSLVSGIHLLSHVTLEDRRSSIEDLRLMILTVSDDIRVVLTILCDRCEILEQAGSLSREASRQMAQDVLNLFAPVAARLGIYTLKQRLERVAFPLVYPLDSERIDEQLGTVHRKIESFLGPAATQLKAALRAEGIEGDVQGREKQSYSIFLKMKSQTVSHIDGLHDLFALRVLVPTMEDCYRVLGIVHRIGHPVQNRFKDYISFPKPNGYQSLHTTVSRLPGVPEGVFVEVQIRTPDMHREAEFGIAAHWSYKQGGAAQRLAQWVQMHKVLEAQQTLQSEALGMTLADHIFVLTPKGTIVELPEGATPLDFAFQIHTDVGLSFRAAKVNGAIVSMDYALENGDVVEILKHRIPRPSPEWMQLLRMASSRSRLKKYLTRGSEDLHPELSPSIKPLRPVTVKLQKKPVRLQRKDALVGMEGGVPMPMRYALCCKPQEKQGSAIVGFINRGGEVMIHSGKCRMCKNANPSRKIEVWWRV